jgi:biotin operon repressor
MTTTTATTTQTYTQWLTDPIKAKISEAASDYAARPVAPGADREQIVEMSKPWVAIASVAIAATAARIAMHQTGADAEIAIATSIAAFAVAVVLGVQAKRRLLCVKRRTRVYAFLAAAAGWTVAAMLTGVTGPMMFTLAIVGIGTSLWHWADHRLGYGWDAPKEEAIYAPTPEVDVYSPLWEQNLAGPGKILHGTALTHYEHLRFGARYAMEVVPGTHTLEEIEHLAAKIRSGLRLKRNHKLIIEEHPTLEAPTLLITIIDSSPVAAGTSWPGLGAMNSDGTIWIGPYLDGEGKALWKLYSTNRIHNGMIAGGTGSGKSRLLENIAQTAAGSQQFPTAVWFADGQDGLSSPLLMRHADYYAGKPEQIVQMLREAVDVIVMQGDENKVNGVQGFTPTEERPGLLIILDECKLVLDKQNNPEFWEETQRLVARIATTGNKAGVGIILAGQEATLPTFGGGGQYPAAIRNNIKGANGVLLKSEEAAGGNIFGVPSATMRSIPSGGGYGFVAGGEGSRKAMMRGFYDDDDTTASNMGSIFWRSVSPMTALDLSPAYRDRKSTADGDLEEAKRRVQKRRERHEAAQRGEHVPAPVRVPQQRSQATGGASAFTSFSLKSEFIGHGPKVEGTAQRVLDAVKAGRTSWKDIATEAGIGRDMVFKHLKDLREQGLVEQASHGRWTLKAQRAA